MLNTQEREKEKGKKEEKGQMKKSEKRGPISQERERPNEEMRNFRFCSNLYGGSKSS